jgi:hypothetical protein
MSTLRTVMDGLHERLSLLEAAFRERRQPWSQPCEPRGGETVGRLSRGSSSSSDSESESESSSDSEGSSSDDSD